MSIPNSESENSEFLSEYEKINSFTFSSKFNSNSNKVQESIQRNNLDLFDVIEEEDGESSSFVVEENSQKKDKKGSISILNVFFLSFSMMAIEFGYSIEIVFITPFFMELETPSLLDSLIWLFPPLTLLIIYPYTMIILKKILGNQIKNKKQALLVFQVISAIGLLLMVEAQNLIWRMKKYNNTARITAMVYAILSFMFVDVGNEMMNAIISTFLEDIEEERKRGVASDLVMWGGSIGRIGGFLVAGLLALDFFVPQIEKIGGNLAFSYFIGFILILFSFLFICVGFNIREDTLVNQGSICNPGSSFLRSFKREAKKLSLNNFLPGITFLRKTPRKMKITLAMHFLASCNILLVSVYGTSWVAMYVLKGDPIEPRPSPKRKLFELGVSWGAQAMGVCSIFSLITQFLFNNSKNSKTNKWAFIVTQLVSSTALIMSKSFYSFKSVYVIIPMSGFAFATFSSIPSYFAEETESEEGLKAYPGIYTKMLNVSMFFAQVGMFCILPTIFLFIPNFDDIAEGLSIAGLFGIGSSVIALFV